MTLKEAVESGRPFRHKEWDCIMWTQPKAAMKMVIKCDQAISDDWEIQQKETFTRSDVERACRTVWARVKLRTLVIAGSDPLDSEYCRWTLEEAMKAAETP